MAKLSAGILSSGRGKVAGVVMAIWKGIAYIRAYAVPSNPNTAGQQAQRAKFTACMTFGQSILSTVIQKFWDIGARGVSGFNRFMSYALNNVGSPANILLARILQGGLESTSSLTGSYNVVSGEITFIWDTATLSNGQATDMALCVVYDEANNISFVDDSGVSRSAGTNVIAVGTGRSAANLKAFVAFYRGFGTNSYISSNSISDQVS